MADLSFDDLIPARPAATPSGAAAPLSFDDLIPAAGGDDDAPGILDRVTNAPAAFGQGVVNTIASIPKSASIASAELADQRLRSINEPYVPPAGDTPNDIAAERIRRSNLHPSPDVVAERRQFLETENSQPVQERPLYRLGTGIENVGKDLMPTDPRLQNEWLSQKIPQGLGSVLGFMATGGAARVAGFGATSAMAVAGAASQGVEQFEDAVKHGASLEDSFKAANIGALVGTSEAVPLAFLLDRLDKGTGGSIKRLLVQAAIQGTEEAAQEAFQNVAGNLIANKIVAYDPQRETFEGTGEAAGLGFSVGALATMIGHLVLGRRARHGQRADDGAPPGAPPAPVPAESVIPAPEGGSGVYTDIVSPAAPGQPASPAPNGPLPAEGASPIEQALQQPNAVVSSPGVTVGSPQPQNGPIISPPSNEAAKSNVAPDGAAVLRAYGYTDEQIAGMSPDQQAAELQDAVAAGVVAAPAAAPPQSAAIAPQIQPVPPQIASPVQRPSDNEQPHGRSVLEKMLKDPRTADEMRADMEKARQEEVAAANWQPSPEWQLVPPAVLRGYDDLTAFSDGGRVETRVQGKQIYARVPPPAGSREAPVELQTPADVHAGAERTKQNLSPAEMESGIYPKRHLKWQGWDISIETEAGATRVAKDGSWSVVMPVPYGHILGTVGADGDPVDISLGPNPQAPNVFVIDQRDPDTLKFDEHKTFQGFDTEQDAIAAYDASFSDRSGPFRIGAVTPMPVPQFNAWLDSGNTKKAVAYQAPRAAPTRKVLSLFEFLAANGGIRDQGGELRSMDLTRHFVPGYGRLVRPNGKPLDSAREAAVEAGYLQDHAHATTTVNDLLTLLRQESAGQRVYSARDVQAAQEREQSRAQRADKERFDAAQDEVRDIAKQNKAALTDDELREIATLALVDGIDVTDAFVQILERGHYAAAREAVSYDSPQEQQDERATAHEPAAADQSSAREPEAGQQPVRPAGEAAPGAAPNREQPRGAQPDRGEAAKPEGGVGADRAAGSADQSIANPSQAKAPEAEPSASVASTNPADNLEIPEFLRRPPSKGPVKAEPLTPVEKAEAQRIEAAGTVDPEIRREADTRWRNWVPGKNAKGETILTRPRLATFIKEVRNERKVAEREAAKAAKAVPRKKAGDAPMFSLGAGEQAAPAPPFYSAVERAIAGVKLNKAPAPQWLNTLRNVPGVKQEELDWLGVADWLKEQNGAVTRDALLGYVRANAIEVKEVEKGATASSMTEEQRERWRELEDYIRQAGVEHVSRDVMQEFERLDAMVPRNGNQGGTKFGSHTLPGGENYRELLLTLPTRSEIDDTERNARVDRWHDFEMEMREKYGTTGTDDTLAAMSPAERERYAQLEQDYTPPSPEQNFRSTHWDEPNVLAHVRFNDRTIEGKRTLFVEEVQSDWHQKGKRQGYDKGEPPPELDPSQWKAMQARSGPGQFDNVWAVTSPDGRVIETSGVRTAEEAIRQGYDRLIDKGPRGVPDAPFKTTWPELAMKRMIRYAAENGYDAVAWTPGEVQADRYDLSTKIDRLYFRKNSDGTFFLRAEHDHGRTFPMGERIPQDKLPDHIGKDAADRILKRIEKSSDKEPGGSLEGLDLKVGGEGMTGFYDQILPATVNKLVKKFGARVERANLKHLDDTGIDTPFIVLDHNGIIVETDIFDEDFAAQRAADIAGSYEFDRTAGATREASVHTLTITPQIREAATGQGFPLFDARRDLTAQAHAARPQLEQQLTTLVRGIAGPNVRVEFPDRIPIKNEHLDAWGSKGEGRSTAAGVYYPAQHLIRVALADPSYRHVGATTLHESFHAVENLLLTDAELAVLKRAEPRLREIAKTYANLTEQQAAEIADFEVRAIAFEAYAHARAKAEPIGRFPAAVRAIMEKLHNLFERVRNALEGLGFKSTKDVFRDTLEGKMAGRVPNARSIGPAAASVRETPKSETVQTADGPREQLVIPGAEKVSDRTLAERQAGGPKRSTKAQKDVSGLPLFGEGSKQGELFSIGQGAPQLPLHPKIDPTPEVIAARLEEHNWPRLAAISSALRFGKINTVEVRTKLQDKFVRWKNIQEAAVRSTGNAIPENLNVYQAESLYYGRTGQRLDALDEGHIDPLIEEIKKRDLTLEEVDRFLMARHAPERNEALRKINPDIADPSGMSDEKAKAILDKIDADGKRADFDAIEKRVRALIDETGQTLVKGGLISAKTLKQWKDAYKNYVPLRGWAEGPNADGSTTPGMGVGRGYDIRGKESKQALGRSSVADGPLAYVMLQGQQAVIRSEKNKVGLTALRFVQQHPDPDLWKVDKGDPKRKIDPATGLVVEADDPTWIHRPNVFAAKIDGVPHYINFQGEYGPNLARALKNLGTANMPAALRFIATLTRLQARLATSWNPDFMIPNFVRDAGEAFINMQAQDQKKFVKQFSKHLLPAIQGSFQAIRGKDGGKYAQAFREFDEAGGRIRFFGLENVEDIKANVEAKMRRLNRGAINNMRSAGEKAVSAIEIANGSIENATRLAAYMAARDVGLTKAQAASIARELTVNFNRKGELGATISALYMFANASAQGTVRMMQGLKGSKRVRRFAYGIAAAGSALALYNMGAGGDDDDGESYYAKIPFWERDTNLIFMWPKGMGHDGKYIKIPLPYGFAFFHVIGARLMTLAMKKEPASKAIPAIIGSTVDAFDPLGRDANRIAQFAPSIVRPAIHLYTNQSWTGRPINPEPLPGRKAEPASSRSFKSASQFSVAAAQNINKWTGGSKHEPGLLDWSPGSIDYTLGFVTGGLGRFALNTTSTAWGAYQSTEWQPDKTPIVRRFIGGVSPDADRALYFDDRQRVMAAHERMTAFAKDGDDAGQKRIETNQRAELAAYSEFKSADARRAQLRAEIEEIKADDKLTAAQREQRVKAKQKEELTAMGEARAKLKAARGGKSE